MCYTIIISRALPKFFECFLATFFLVFLKHMLIFFSRHGFFEEKDLKRKKKLYINKILHVNIRKIWSLHKIKNIHFSKIYWNLFIIIGFRADLRVTFLFNLFKKRNNTRGFLLILTETFRNFFWNKNKTCRLENLK